MNTLILSQKTTDLQVSVFKNALPKNCNVTVITCSELKEHEYIKSPDYEPSSIVNRLRCWINYYQFVLKWSNRVNADRYQLIFATSNPPLNSRLGVKLKKKLNAPFVYMNWDLYPQVIELSMRGVVPKVLSKCWHAMNNQIYPHIDQMLTIGTVMGETINEPLKKKIDIKTIPMFTDTEKLKPIDKRENPFCIQNHWEDKFIVLFSGKMGRGHNLEILLDASKKLRDYKDILFLFIGEGEKYKMVGEWIAAEKAPNAVLLPLQPEDIFPYSMACGDVGFISQEREIAKAFMPAKTYDMMACGLMLLAYAEGTDDLSMLINKNNLGIVLTENNSDKLAQIILDIYQNPQKRLECGHNSRKIAESQFDIRHVTEKYREAFETVLKE